MALITRGKNANTHPGAIIHNSSGHRPTKVVQAERAAKAELKAKKLAVKEAAIEKVAKLENQVRKEIIETDLEANNLKDLDKLPLRRAMHTKKPNSDTASSTLQVNTRLSVMSEGSSVPVMESDSAVNEKSEALLHESIGSHSEYEDNGEENESDNEGGTKEAKKKGLMQREKINAIAVAITSNLPNVVTTKRKAGLGSPTDSSGAKRAKSQSQIWMPKEPAGLVANWKKSHALHHARMVDTVQVTNTRTQSILRGTLDSGNSTSGEMDEPAFMPGGIPSDDEGPGIERHALEASIARADHDSDVTKPQVIVKVEDLHSVPTHFKRTVKGINENHHPQPTNADLPPGTVNKFYSLVIPMVYDTMGVLSPWESLPDGEVVELWNTAFGDSHPIDTGDPKFAVVKSLMKRSASSWLHKFADAGEQAVIDELARQGLTTIDEKVEFISILLGDVNDISTTGRPFIWKSTYEDPSTEKPFGIFQGRLIAQTFLEHILLTAKLPDEYHARCHPIGALVASIQAVHWALLYSKSGSFQPPAAKIAAAFSKANWGDFDTVLPNGKTKLTKRSSVFLKMIDRLKDRQWDNICKAALALHNVPPVTPPKQDVEEATEGELGDEALVDLMYESDGEGSGNGK